jgi:hypothetical protein
VASRNFQHFVSFCALHNKKESSKGSRSILSLNGKLKKQKDIKNICRAIKKVKTNIDFDGLFVQDKNWITKRKSPEGTLVEF